MGDVADVRIAQDAAWFHSPRRELSPARWTSSLILKVAVPEQLRPDLEQQLGP
jgi:hypothetical protein